MVGLVRLMTVIAVAYSKAHTNRFGGRKHRERAFLASFPLRESALCA